MIIISGFHCIFSHLHLGLPSGFFPPGFPAKSLYMPLPSPIRATYLAHPILLDLITRIIFREQYRSLSSSLCSFLHFPVTSSILGRNTLLNTLFSNTLSLCSSLYVSDQVSHPIDRYTEQKCVYQRSGFYELPILSWSGVRLGPFYSGLLYRCRMTDKWLLSDGRTTKKRAETVDLGIGILHFQSVHLSFYIDCFGFELLPFFARSRRLTAWDLVQSLLMTLILVYMMISKFIWVTCCLTLCVDEGSRLKRKASCALELCDGTPVVSDECYQPCVSKYTQQLLH